MFENNSIGALIKRYRIDRKMSRKELADKLGVSVHTISKYEQEERNPSISTLIEISHILKVDIKYLLNMPDYVDEEAVLLENLVRNTDDMELLIKTILLKNKFINQKITNNFKNADCVIDSLAKTINTIFTTYLSSLQMAK